MKRIIEFSQRYLLALFSCVYLFTLGVFSVRHRGLLEHICAHFGLLKSWKLELPGISINALFKKEDFIQIREPGNTSGNVTPFELIIITKLVQCFKPKTIFEIGTFDGRTTLNLAANSSNDVKVYTLDLPRNKLNDTKLPVAQGDKEFINKDQSGLRFVGSDCEKKITQLYGDSGEFDFSPYYDKIDFIFVDGAHSYEYVMSDTENALRILSNNGGIILWHDYGGWEGATRALNGLCLNDARFKMLKHINRTSLAYLMVKKM